MAARLAPSGPAPCPPVPGPLGALAHALDEIAAGRPPGPAPDPGGTPFATLASLFGLSPAAGTILLLAAAAEFDAPVASRVAALRGLPGLARADVATALALTPNEGWKALCPGAPMRRWRLVDLAGRAPHLRRELAVDERVLHFLMGWDYIDARLDGIVTTPHPTPEPSPAEAALARRLATAWAEPGAWPVLVIGGGDSAALAAVGGATARSAGFVPLCLDAAAIPGDPAARQAIAILVDRELALSGAALVVDTTDGATAAAAFAEALIGPVVLVGPDPALPRARSRLRADLPGEAREGRRVLWRQVLGPAAEGLGPEFERLVEQFALDRRGIEAAGLRVLTERSRAPGPLFPRLWESAREQGRGRLDGLAERIESRVGWEDLVLPREQTIELRDLADQVRFAARIRGTWGWEDRGTSGLGAAALFAGPSGAGKTLAAEVLAGELALDLYRIDLAQVVSKYIGETEKNLERIFAAAENGGAILLFDEADALFGRRSEVRDSHDRYANIEVSYLLQRMESYRGLAILTTNQKSALDQAFLRRLRAVITFPFPDAAARAEIWTRVFPHRTPREGLDPERLARLPLAGGSIRSIALNASGLAAAAGAPVRPGHILAAARREYAKLGKPLTNAELGSFL